MDEGRITRAGVLLFSHYPEKHVPACFSRIGFFSDEATIEFEDEIHGSLIEQAEKIVELLYLKYMVAPVTFDGMTRVEKYAFPPDAVREIVYNALVHSDWSRGIPLQVKVYADKMFVSNVAVLPRDLTEEKLLGPHRSEPYNPRLAQVFYRAGYIESWGRGVDKIRDACKKNGDVAGRVPVGELLEHFRLARRQPRERRDGRFPMIISPRLRISRRRSLG